MWYDAGRAKGLIPMCPTCQVDAVVALVGMSLAMTLYMLFHRGIIGKGKTLRNVVVVFGLLLFFGVVGRVITVLAHPAHAGQEDTGSATEDIEQGPRF